MPRYHVVTDSAATFRNARVMKQYPITVVPFIVEMNGRKHRDGVEFQTDDTISRFADLATMPRVIAPSVDDYAQVYGDLLQTCDGIISIHPSRELSGSWQNARLAAQRFAGTRPISVIDSRSVGVGQAMLTRVAVQASVASEDFHEIVQRVRHAVDRLYSMYIVDTLDHLRENGIINEPHGILGAYLGIRPVLNIEEGLIQVTGKVKNRSAAVERLYDFASEFDHLEEAMIVQPREFITDDTRNLQDRLAVEFPGQHFPFTIYGPVVASLLGANATGVIILESEMDSLDNEEEDQDYYG